MLEAAAGSICGVVSRRPVTERRHRQVPASGVIPEHWPSRESFRQTVATVRCCRCLYGTTSGNIPDTGRGERPVACGSPQSRFAVSGLPGCRLRRSEPLLGVCRATQCSGGTAGLRSTAGSSSTRTVSGYTAANEATRFASRFPTTKSSVPSARAIGSAPVQRTRIHTRAAAPLLIASLGDFGILSEILETVHRNAGLPAQTARNRRLPPRRLRKNTAVALEHDHRPNEVALPRGGLGGIGEMSGEYRRLVSRQPRRWREEAYSASRRSAYPSSSS